MNIRTDIALESHNLLPEKHRKGIKVAQWKRKNIEIVKVEIVNDAGERSTGKPKGKYFTVELPEFSHESELIDSRLEIIIEIIKDLIPKNTKSFLIAGIGNENITPDALGPLCAKRFFQQDISKILPSFNSIFLTLTLFHQFPQVYLVRQALKLPNI